MLAPFYILVLRDLAQNTNSHQGSFTAATRQAHVGYGPEMLKSGIARDEGDAFGQINLY